MKNSPDLAPGAPHGDARGGSVTSLVVRPAVEADLPLLAHVELAADARFAEIGRAELATMSPIPEDVARRAVAEARLVVADLAGELVGWIYTAPWDDELCIGQISVLPSHGRRGIGSRLLDAAIDKARAEGYRSVVLNTELDVPWNAPWYARRGFEIVPREAWTPRMERVVGEQEAFGLRWLRRAHMRRTLSRP